MNDADLKSLYRRMTRNPAAGVDADEMHDALSRSGAADIEGTPLDRIAASAAHADLLRAALALAPDATMLSREVAALRAPRRVGPARGWLALAAGVGSAAILIAALRPGTGPVPVAVEAEASQASSRCRLSRRRSSRRPTSTKSRRSSTRTSIPEAQAGCCSTCSDTATKWQTLPVITKACQTACE
jgi:hypothetical protein